MFELCLVKLQSLTYTFDLYNVFEVCDVAEVLVSSLCVYAGYLCAFVVLHLIYRYTREVVIQCIE